MSVLGPNVQSLSEQIPGILLIPAGSPKDSVGFNIGLNMFFTSKANSRTRVETKHPWPQDIRPQNSGEWSWALWKSWRRYPQIFGPKGHGNVTVRSVSEKVPPNLPKDRGDTGTHASGQLIWSPIPEWGTRYNVTALQALEPITPVRTIFIVWSLGALFRSCTTCNMLGHSTAV